MFYKHGCTRKVILRGQSSPMRRDGGMVLVKRIKWLCVLLPLVVHSVANMAQANPTGVTILSQSHHVYGWIGTDPPLSYDYTDNFPISGSVSGDIPGYTCNPVTAFSSAGNFSVSASADMANELEMGWAQADSVYVFTANTDELTLAVTGFIEYFSFHHVIRCVLTDRSSGLRLADYVSDDRYDSVPWPPGGPFSWQDNYTFSAGHEYELSLHAYAEPGDAMGGFASLNADIFPTIPSPSALMLAAIGVGSVSWLRKNKTL